jgi:hypothetical protein
VPPTHAPVLVRPRPPTSGDAPLTTAFLVDSPAAFYYYDCPPEHDRGWGCAYRCLQMMLGHALTHHAARYRPLLFPSLAADEHQAVRPYHEHALTRCSVVSSSAWTCSWCQSALEDSALRCVPCALLLCRSCIDQCWVPPDRLCELMPTIVDIQRTLAECAPHRFAFTDVGSTKWMEPPDAHAYLLAHGVPSVSLSVNAGTDMVRLLTLLQSHLAAYQAPVMIDDVVKAYVIMGVCWDSATTPLVDATVRVLLDPSFSWW